IFQGLLVSSIELIAVGNDPGGGQALALERRLTSIGKTTDFDWHARNGDAFAGDPSVEAVHALGHGKSCLAAQAHPGLGKSDAAHHVAGAHANPGVGPDQQSLLMEACGHSTAFWTTPRLISSHCGCSPRTRSASCQAKSSWPKY